MGAGAWQPDLIHATAIPLLNKTRRKCGGNYLPLLKAPLAFLEAGLNVLNPPPTLLANGFQGLRGLTKPPICCTVPLKLLDSQRGQSRQAPDLCALPELGPHSAAAAGAGLWSGAAAGHRQGPGGGAGFGRPSCCSAEAVFCWFCFLGGASLVFLAVFVSLGW